MHEGQTCIANSKTQLTQKESKICIFWGEIFKTDTRGKMIYIYSAFAAINRHLILTHKQLFHAREETHKNSPK